MMNNFHAFSEDAKNAGEKIDEVLKEALKASENLANLTELFEKVMERVARGEGTVGRFLVKDDFYMDLKAILGKAQILMGDITQYGLLFQNSKKWQRVQAGRQNLVGQLQSPWEFENFFGREVCGIQRSLNDLGERLEEPNCDPRAFCSDLREMMRRVDGLNEHLQMFNTQLHDAGGCR
jgi:phospholipid/cholesterol/gamma-HCH transport system substrate-binding protein